MPKCMELHPETAPVFDLPEDIYYYNRRFKNKLLIVGFLSRNEDQVNKSFSINKYPLETAYYKAVEFIYGNRTDEIISKYPVPYIHPDDMYVFVRRHEKYVYGVSVSFSPSGMGYLSGFLVREESREESGIQNRYFLSVD